MQIGKRRGPPLPTYRLTEHDSLFWARICQALGTSSRAFAREVVNRLAKMPKDMAQGDGFQRIDAGLAFIAGHEPQSEGEALLLLNAWLTHRAFARHIVAVEAADSIATLEITNAIAAKLGTLMVRQLELLGKLRGGGKQEVTVTHVHQHVYVADGGQAVVGHLAGGGGDFGNRSQSEAPALALGDAGGAQVWGEDALGLALQGTEDRGAVPVPDAWRPSRSAERPSQRRVETRPGDQGNARDAGRARADQSPVARASRPAVSPKGGDDANGR